VAQAAKPHKLKSSKSSKVHQKNTTFPMKVKRLQGVFDKEPTITDNKLRPTNFLDKVLPVTGLRAKHYENIPNLLLLRNKALKKSKKKKNGRQLPLEEEIPMEEQRMIDNEILHPKTTDSDYYFNSLGNKKDKYKRPSGESLGDDKPLNSDDLRAEIALNNAQSPKSVVIKDSESSEKEASQRGESPMKESMKGEADKGDPLSQKNLDKWMYLLNEFKKCGKNGYVDEDLKVMLMDFCHRTQKDINTLVNPINSKHSLKSDHRLSNPEEEGKAKGKKKLNLGIDVEKINEEFNKKAYPIKENRSSSFQWLRAEYEQNVGEISNLLGNNESDTLKKIQVISELMKEAMELNQKPSEMFELRNMAILKRYEAEKEQIEQEKGSQGKQEELENLEEWYREELESLQSEKKKITKGWFTSIEAVRKIKRDLEFVAEVKKQPTLVQKASKYSNEPTVFNLISRSLGSPTSKHMDKEGRKLAKEVSPMISPHATSNYSQAKIISDPNIMSMKIKQGDILRKNEELAKSIEHLDPNKLKRNRMTCLRLGSRSQMPKR
jgi:hypothetical protein